MLAQENLCKYKFLLYILSSKYFMLLQSIQIRYYTSPSLCGKAASLCWIHYLLQQAIQLWTMSLCLRVHLSGKLTFAFSSRE